MKIFISKINEEKLYFNPEKNHFEIVGVGQKTITTFRLIKENHIFKVRSKTVTFFIGDHWDFEGVINKVLVDHYESLD